MRGGDRLAVVTERRVVVPGEAAERLTDAASWRGTSVEEVSSEAVGTYVGRRRLAFAGALHGGRADLSERAEELLGLEPAS